MVHTLPNNRCCITKKIISVLRSKNCKSKFKLERLAELRHLMKKSMTDYIRDIDVSLSTVLGTYCFGMCSGSRRGTLGGYRNNIDHTIRQIVWLWPISFETLVRVMPILWSKKKTHDELLAIILKLCPSLIDLWSWCILAVDKNS